MAVSGTFAATGQSAEFTSPVGRKTLIMGLSSATWGSVTLEVKMDASWYPVEVFTANASRLIDTDGRSSIYRFNCTARSADISYFLE